MYINGLFKCNTVTNFTRLLNRRFYGVTWVVTVGPNVTFRDVTWKDNESLKRRDNARS